MTDGRTDGRTDGGDCNIPSAFLKKRGDNKKIITILRSKILLILTYDHWFHFTLTLGVATATLISI